MKKVLIGAMIVLTVLAVFSVRLAVESRSLLETQSKQAEASLAAQAEEEKAYRDRLADWVYQNSSKIARSAARPIVDEAMKYDHPLLLLALIQAESEFSPTAESYAQAVGLGQIRWSVWGKVLINAGICKEPRDLYDIGTNIRAANHILTNEIKATNGNYIRALERYVGGKHKRYVDQVAYNHLHLAMIRK